MNEQTASVTPSVLLPVRPPDLPTFNRPPVDEVVLGLSYPPIVGFTDAVIAEYRNRLGSAFPGMQYQPRLEVLIEQLSEAVLAPQTMMAPSPQPFGRSWLVSADESRLIQLQNDLYLYNWRQRSEPYPRFETIFEEFWLRFRQLRDTVTSVIGVPVPRPHQLELSYINWVRDLRIEEFLIPANRTSVVAPRIDRTPRAQQWAASFLVRDTDGGRPVARLNAVGNPAIRIGPDSPQEGVQFQISFRMPMAPNSADEALAEAIALGRNSIVWAFAQLTTEPAHEKWEKRE